MASDREAPRRRFQFSLKTLLLLFIPFALLIALARWLFWPPPVDVALSADRFCRYEDGAGALPVAVEVRAVNRSPYAVWHLENPRYCLLECVDGIWLPSWSGTGSPEDPEKAWWSVQEAKQSVTILVGPVSEKASAIKVGIPFTTDRFAPKAHWVLTPEVKIVRKGQDWFPEVEEGAKEEVEVLPLR